MEKIKYLMKSSFCWIWMRRLKFYKSKSLEIVQRAQQIKNQADIFYLKSNLKIKYVDRKSLEQ